MLLDIFAGDAQKKLGETSKDGDVVASMSQILKPKLDELLVPKGEFMFWYAQQLERLDRIRTKIERIKDMLQSVKPLNYKGRIIISTTDDTERKVIAHHGGVRWKRLVNFLRGVEFTDWRAGDRFGEEYVCLRESNIPLHTHAVTLKGDSDSPYPETTGPAEWIQQERGGHETRIIGSGESSDQTSRSTENKVINYQISPLEYGRKDYAVIPHDNMPPYREVYIWECVEATKEERSANGEEENEEKFRILWDANGGSWGDGSTKVKTTFVSSGQNPTPPNDNPSRASWRFNKWMDRYGNPFDST